MGETDVCFEPGSLLWMAFLSHALRSVFTKTFQLSMSLLSTEVALLSNMLSKLKAVKPAAHRQ